jgi:L-gulonolactone oxidase
MLDRGPTRFVNWAGNQRARPRRRHAPTSEDEIVSIVRGVRERGETLRVVGAGHSWSDAALSDDNLVTLDRYADVVAVDHDQRRVTVKAGMRLSALVVALDRVGLAMENLGSIAAQTVAGAIATGTHGTGLGHGILATQVVSLRLVDGTGEVHTLCADDGDDLLDAARVSLGCLGVLTELTLRCRDAFDLEERAWSLPFAEVARTLPELAREHEHLKAWWLPHTGRVQIFAFTPTAAPRAGAGRASRALDDAINKTVFPAILGVGRALPRTLPELNRLVGRTYFQDRRRVARSDLVFNVAMPPRHLEMEYGIPVDALPEALTDFERLIARHRLHVDMVQEVRFVAPDDCHLSPAHGRESCQLGAYISNPRDRDAFFAGFEALALAADGRPHWGKLFNVGALELAPRFLHWDRFQELRRRFDPDRVFASAFTRRVLG